MRRVLMGVFLAALGASVHAAPAASDADFIAAVRQEWANPRAADLVRDSRPLTPAIQALCDASAGDADAALQAARRQWLSALASWESLTAVSIGPVLERRAQRQIDFTPTRPRMIEKAIKAAPASAADMELIGTPAKGFPALEWLLWVRPAQPGSPACAYATQVAAEIEREASALAAARPAAVEPKAALSELVNQWVGGLERLRWSDMEMPLRVAMTSAKAVVPEFPRWHSGASGVSWHAKWRGLRDLASGPVSMASLLRARGQSPRADILTQAVARVDAAMLELGSGDSDRILAAGKTLAALKRLVQGEIAPALGVSIGFSDADGD